MPTAVRPPEYFPRLAYCALFFAAERFVVADTLPYSRQSFQNRTRLRQPHGAPAWQWLSIPLQAGAPGQPIGEVAFDARTRWRQRHLRALQYDYGSAPFFGHYAPQVRQLLEQPWPTLGALTTATVAWVHRMLRAPSELLTASDLPGRPANVPALLRAVGAGRLVTLPESAEADRGHAAEAGVAVEVVAYEETPRRQNFEGFEPGCSVLDLLFNYGPEAAAVLQAGLDTGESTTRGAAW